MIGYTYLVGGVRIPHRKEPSMTQFTLHVQPAGTTYLTRGDTGAKYGTVAHWDARLHGVWTFLDGVEVQFRNAVRSTTSYWGQHGGRGRVERTRESEITKKGRVYVSDDRAFNLAEDLSNRTRRPQAILRAAAIDGLARIGIVDVKLKWSQYAGCSMCPCSPGFIIDSTDKSLQGIDLWVTVPGIPVVDESKPARDLSLVAL